MPAELHDVARASRDVARDEGGRERRERVAGTEARGAAGTPRVARGRASARGGRSSPGASAEVGWNHAAASLVASLARPLPHPHADAREGAVGRGTRRGGASWRGHEGTRLGHARAVPTPGEKVGGRETWTSASVGSAARDASRGGGSTRGGERRGAGARPRHPAPIEPKPVSVTTAAHGDARAAFTGYTESSVTTASAIQRSETREGAPTLGTGEGGGAKTEGGWAPTETEYTRRFRRMTRTSR